MELVKFGDYVKEVKINIDRNNNPYEYYVAGDHMDSEDLTIRRKGLFATDDVGPAFTRLFKPGQILYGSRRTYLKKVAVADFEGICSNTTFVLETKDENKLRQQLLPFIMLTDDFTKWSISKSKGSTNPYILFSDLANYEFELPDINRQDELVNLLWQAYATKESYREMIRATDEMVKSQFIEMFGRVSDKQPKYPIMKLSECCSYISDGSHFSPEGDSNGPYPMLSVKDMTETGFSYSECKYIGEKDYKNLVQNGCKPRFGDVLVAKDGSYFKYAFALVNELEQAILSSIAILRPIQATVSSRYLAYYMLTDAVIRLVEDNYLTGTAIKRVILKGFKEIPIIVPPLDSQNVFVRVLEQADKSKFMS